jgi:hypothetical protein
MMLSADAAIARMRRAITLGIAVRALLWAAAVASLICAWLMPSSPPVDGRIALIVVAVLWVTLSVRSWQSTRLNADVPHLLATGEFDAAEEQIDRSLRSFSLFRPIKLVALHQLAVLRMAQGKFADAATICHELLGHRLGMMGSLSRSSRLMLAQALLEQGEPRQAVMPLASLSGERLSLAETLNLLHLELDYGARVGDWQRMFDGYMGKVQLAEVMPAGASARVQASLALAARQVGRADVADWLSRRAALLADPAELVRQRPALAEIWPASAGTQEDGESGKSAESDKSGAPIPPA